ncbi:hypothetical protein PoB_007206100 [Plakobranchus ocellatus]|uniref:Uncharacterized protein n=1 Tax=Plakobranchus ocellatus TaxID=259542 RepID=A0AAV4DNW6_9GAST|nr:hypothetical protein PoB_007206100 [Plakobranchus ocellatus]
MTEKTNTFFPQVVFVYSFRRSIPTRQTGTDTQTLTKPSTVLSGEQLGFEMGLSSNILVQSVKCHSNTTVNINKTLSMVLAPGVARPHRHCSGVHS